MAMNLTLINTDQNAMTTEPKDRRQWKGKKKNNFVCANTPKHLPFAWDSD